MCVTSCTCMYACIYVALRIDVTQLLLIVSQNGCECVLCVDHENSCMYVCMYICGMYICGTAQ